MTMQVNVVEGEDIDALIDCLGAEMQGPSVCGFDLEGVDLGRTGTVELMSLYFPNQDIVFVVDIPSVSKDLILVLKGYLEREETTCVVHDCRQDSDALYNIHDIKLGKVHDTSCFHACITGDANKNINDVLAYNELKVNVHRMQVDYRTNHAHWECRPLTREMIDHAANDVAQLPTLREFQLKGATAAQALFAAESKSSEKKTTLRDMQTVWIACRRPMGEFIGRRGCGIRAAERNTGCFFYGRGESAKRKQGFLVYYKDDQGLQKARRALGY